MIDSRRKPVHTDPAVQPATGDSDPPRPNRRSKRLSAAVVTAAGSALHLRLLRRFALRGKQCEMTIA